MTDELGLYAHPRQAIVVTSSAQLVDEVAALVEKDAISEVIVGLPLTLAGRESEQAQDVHNFVARLRTRLQVPVREWDERLSTTAAARHAGGARNRRSGALDSEAASLILQAVVDARRLVGAP